MPSGPGDARHRFSTAFRRSPPPWLLSCLLLAGALFAQFRYLKKSPVPEQHGASVMFVAEQDLLRLQAADGLDTTLARLTGDSYTVASMAAFLQSVQDEGLLPEEWHWYKVMTEIEAGDLNAARTTAAPLSPYGYPFALCVRHILDGTPVPNDDRGDLLRSAGKQGYSWWMSRLFHRLDLAEGVPELERALQERADGIRTRRVWASLFSCTLLLVSLVGIPFLWRLMRRRVAGKLLPPNPKLPSLLKAFAGAWAVSEAICILGGYVVSPAIMNWMAPQAGSSQGIVWLPLWCFYAVVSLSLVFLPAWLTARLCHGRWRLAMRYCGARLKDFKHWPSLLAAAGCFIPLLLIYWAAETVCRMAGLHYDYLDMFSRFQPAAGWYDVLFDVALACIAAPLAEELLFRGYFLEGLKRITGFWPAAALSSVLFSALHYYSLPGFIVTMIFGLVMACVMHRTGKLSICIVAHGLLNLQWTLAMHAI